jgi:hypothetical protein
MKMHGQAYVRFMRDERPNDLRDRGSGGELHRPDAQDRASGAVVLIAGSAVLAAAATELNLGGADDSRLERPRADRESLT